MGRKPKLDNYYIDPEQLDTEIGKYKTTKVISDDLGLMFLKIARRFASKPNYSSYTYKEEFIGDAVARMCEKIDYIDLDHPNSNPFSYLTMICWHCFIAKIMKEKKYQKTKEKFQNENYTLFKDEEGLVDPRFYSPSS